MSYLVRPAQSLVQVANPPLQTSNSSRLNISASMVARQGAALTLRRTLTRVDEQKLVSLTATEINAELESYEKIHRRRHYRESALFNPDGKVLTKHQASELGAIIGEYEYTVNTIHSQAMDRASAYAREKAARADALPDGSSVMVEGRELLRSSSGGVVAGPQTR